MADVKTFIVDAGSSAASAFRPNKVSPCDRDTTMTPQRPDPTDRSINEPSATFSAEAPMGALQASVRDEDRADGVFD
jgi:hypothetical protein